jgi:hypothetical protein
MTEMCRYISGAAQTRTRPATSEATQVRPDVAVAWLRDLGALRREATEDERARLLHAVYDCIVVRTEGFVAAHLTPHAWHGLALALPEEVDSAVMARPAGFEPAT